MEKDFQRWTAKRKVELLLQLIKGETKLVDACREHDLKQSEVESWMEIFLKGGERSTAARGAALGAGFGVVWPEPCCKIGLSERMAITIGRRGRKAYGAAGGCAPRRA